MFINVYKKIYKKGFTTITLFTIFNNVKTKNTKKVLYIILKG